MQLLRGAGTRAMAGITAATDTGVIRPLLRWRRRDVIEWLREHELSWIEDSSNEDLGHLRNAVRHLVLPQLRGLAPRIDDHTVALAESLADDENFFSAELERLALWIDPMGSRRFNPSRRAANARPIAALTVDPCPGRANRNRSGDPPSDRAAPPHARPGGSPCADPGRTLAAAAGPRPGVARASGVARALRAAARGGSRHQPADPRLASRGGPRRPAVPPCQVALACPGVVPPDGAVATSG